MNERVERAGIRAAVQFQRIGGVCGAPGVRVLLPVCLLAMLGCGSNSKGSAVETHVDPPPSAEDGGVTPGTVEGGSPDVDTEPASAAAEDGGVIPAASAVDGSPGANPEPAGVAPEDAGGSLPLDDSPGDSPGDSPDTPTAPGSAPECVLGEKLDDEQASCVRCSAGEYCAGGDTPAYPCSPGEACVDGASLVECEGNQAFNTDPTEACQPWTVCGAGQPIATEGTGTSDRVCGGAQPAIQYGTANDDWVYAVCTTESGELLIAGSTEGALEGNSRTGERDAYLRKLNAQGVVLWTTVWGEEGGITSASHCATTEAGNTHIVGSLGGETVLSIFDPEGQLISRETIELPEYESIAGAAPLPNGGVVLISGHAVGASGISVESYDSEGHLVEQWALDSDGEDFAEAVATDPEGSIFVGGATEGPFGDDEAAHSLPGLSPVAFVRKYDISGQVQWTRYLGTAMYDRVLSLTTDDAGNVYFAGRTSGDLLEFDNAGNDDVFVGAYSADGTLLWLHQQGGELFDWPSSIAVHPDGTVYVGGSSGISDADGSQYTGMVWSYDSEGTPIDTLEFAEGENTNVREVVVTPQGAVYVAGTTNGSLEGNTSQGALDSFYQRIR